MVVYLRQHRRYFNTCQLSLFCVTLLFQLLCSICILHGRTYFHVLHCGEKGTTQHTNYQEILTLLSTTHTKFWVLNLQIYVDMQ